MNNVVVMLAIIVFASGCATSSEIRKLSVGMDKKEVVNVLGEPISTRATKINTDMVEIWDYRFAKTAIGFPPFIRDTYWIFFK